MKANIKDIFLTFLSLKSLNLSLETSFNIHVKVIIDI
jgi:hypothetical protein